MLFYLPIAFIFTDVDPWRRLLPMLTDADARIFLA